MSNIYITGHRNPDLDSVCSALAYADLKNRLDDKNKYIPVRCGHLGESTKKILESLEIEAPEYMKDVYPKVADVMLTSTDKIDADEQLTEVAKGYKRSNPSVMPIWDEGKFFGLLSVDDISSWFMNTLAEFERIPEIPKVRDVMRKQEAPVQVTDLFEDAKLSFSQSQKRGLAVFDAEEYVGYLTKRCFLKAPRYNVILVDHNEAAQSIKGIETANTLEIIDHHRLDAFKTDTPIFIDSEPLGSTCTIVYQLFIRNRLTPDKHIAKVLLTGMLSDTLVLKSPTTTAVDVESAKALAKICGVDVTEFGLEMFTHVERLGTQDPQKAILSDFKQYKERGVKVGIGQCEVTTLKDVEEYKSLFLSSLDEIRAKNGLDWAVVMITDVITENSILLTTDYKSAKLLPYKTLENGILDMPGVMSRKKQLLPEIIYAIGM